jgi:hypothetical protein
MKGFTLFPFLICVTFLCNELYHEIKTIDNKDKVCFMTAFEVNYQAIICIFSTAITSDYIGCFIRKPFDVEELIKHIEAELI